MRIYYWKKRKLLPTLWWMCDDLLFSSWQGDFFSIEDYQQKPLWNHFWTSHCNLKFYGHITFLWLQWKNTVVCCMTLWKWYIPYCKFEMSHINYTYLILYHNFIFSATLIATSRLRLILGMLHFYKENAIKFIFPISNKKYMYIEVINHQEFSCTCNVILLLHMWD